MFQLLKRLFQSPEEESSAGQGAKVADRLRHLCARDYVDQQGDAPGESATGPGPDPAALDRSQSKLKQSKDTHPELSLEDTHPVAAGDTPAAPVPSVLQRLWSCLKPPPPFPDDQRVGQRYPFGQVHRQLKVLVGSSKWPAEVRDISLTGVALVLGMRLDPGKAMRLVIVAGSQNMTWPVQARVVRIELLPQGDWLICCRFDKPLPQQELNALL